MNTLKMPLKLLIICFSLWAYQSIFAEDRVIVVSPASDLQEHFNLDAVAQLFKDSDSLQQFEYMLNDPKLFVNNLDLNQDGNVDFIRVIEQNNSEGRLIILQAILGPNSYTDVAYIDITYEGENLRLQIRGESSLYGDHYYYVPRYENISTWPIIVSIFDPYYSYYYSPYDWGFYPHGWKSYNCVRIGLYRSRISFSYHANWFRRSHIPCIRNYHRHHHFNHRSYVDYYKHRRYNDHHRKDYDRHNRDRDYYKHDRDHRYGDRNRHDNDRRYDSWRDKNRNHRDDRFDRNRDDKHRDRNNDRYKNDHRGGNDRPSKHNGSIQIDNNRNRYKEKAVYGDPKGVFNKRKDSSKSYSKPRKVENPKPTNRSEPSKRREVTPPRPKREYSRPSPRPNREAKGKPIPRNDR